MEPVALLRKHIKARGLRGTAQREDILRFVAAVRGHAGLEDIFQGVRARSPGVGRATVFRTVKLLEEIGLVSRVTFADGLPRYEYAVGRARHDHLICVECGEAQEFSSPGIERLQSTAARARGFRILWHRHEIFGRCARCVARSSRVRDRNDRR